VLAPSLALNALLAGGTAAALVALRRTRARLHLSAGRELGWPIRMVPPSEVDDAFATGAHGPTTAAEVRFIGSGDGVPGGTSDPEARVLAVLAKRARRMFEFGTCSGRTAYLWAVNSPPDARISTITLAPDQHDQYRAEPSDLGSAAERALGASTFTEFLYTGTEAEGKVEQLFGDSKALDESPWTGQCDLVFVDGSHAYSYVRSDSEKALRMVAPGGLVLWHDYSPLRSNTRGVFRYLNELSSTHPLVHIRGTTLVAYRAPDGARS
jgi:predicted O-methyltransferase YrrM